jgi:hypothetical protein
VVVVYSPLMTRSRPECAGFGRPLAAASYLVLQAKTGNNANYQPRRVDNPLVAGSSPARPTSEPIFKIAPPKSSFVIVYADVAVEQVPDLRVHPAPRHVAVLSHAEVGVAEMMGADPS